MNSGGTVTLYGNPASLPGGTFNWNGGTIRIGSNSNFTLTNALTIESGRTLEVDGILNISANSVLTNNGTLTNDGILNLNPLSELILNTSPAEWPGGTFNWNSNSTVRIGPNGSLSLATILDVESGRTLEVDGMLDIDANGTLNIDDNGILTNNGTLTNDGTLHLHPGSELILNTAPASLPGGTFNWDFASTVSVGPNGILTVSGIFSVLSQRSLKVDGILNIDANGTLNIGFSSGLTTEPGGLININGILSLVTNGLNNNGTLNLNSGGEFVFDINNSAWPGGTFNWNSGSTVRIGSSGQLALASPLSIESGRTLKVDGTLDIDPAGVLTNEGALIIKGTLENNGAFNNTSIMSGTGTFKSNHINNGTVSPGLSPGCFNFDNDFTNTGTLEIELADGSACTNYDQIIVAGAATIGGIINITFPSGAPSTTTFAILTATGSKTDNSPTINWPAGYSGSGSFVGNEYQVTFSLLPVELMFFEAIVLDEAIVELKWQTASEQNNMGFEVQRSQDGTSWNTIGFEDGAGSTSEQQQYSYLDRPGLTGKLYYRLRQIDFDGKSEYSLVRVVELNKQEVLFKVFPTPASSFINIQLENDWENEVTLIIVNALGQEVFTQQVFKSEGMNEWQLDLNDFVNGIYYVNILNEKERLVQRFIKK